MLEQKQAMKGAEPSGVQIGRRRVCFFYAPPPEIEAKHRDRALTALEALAQREQGDAGF